MAIQWYDGVSMVLSIGHIEKGSLCAVAQNGDHCGAKITMP